MTNKNKNTNELVAETDDPTLDTDLHDSFRNLPQKYASDCEVDARTFDIDDINGELSGQSRTELKKSLKEHVRLIEEFRYEIEQFRGRQRGMEEELKARVEIFENISAELSDSQARLGETKDELVLRGDEARAAETALLTANKSIDRLTDQSKGLKNASLDLKRKIKSLEAELRSSNKTVLALQKDLRIKQKLPLASPQGATKQDSDATNVNSQLQDALSDLHDLRNYVNGRKDDWISMENALAETRELLNSERSRSGEMNRELEERNAQLVRSREQYISASDQLATHKSKIRKLGKKYRDLERGRYQDAKNEVAESRAKIADQEGEIATQSHEIAALLKDNARIERYSDALRIQLQDHVSTTRASVTMRHNLEAGLDAANAMLTKLRKQLEAEQICNAEQVEMIDKQRKDFDREVRQIRFELGAAEETLAGQQTLNEKLASDLIDTQGFRRELETLLTENASENENSIKELSAQLTQAKQHATECERDIESKNRTIADMMQELSKYTKNIELETDTENVLQKIDGFRKDSDELRESDERDRVARLLIGDADGRELRFPLFKNRLTIGRTSYNDIQLNMQFVSRRHAVISTDHGRTRVIDWGSKNGVFVNDVKVSERILKSGDRVTIGTTDFKYEERTKR